MTIPIFIRRALMSDRNPIRRGECSARQQFAVRGMTAVVLEHGKRRQSLEEREVRCGPFLFGKERAVKVRDDGEKAVEGLRAYAGPSGVVLINTAQNRFECDRIAAE